MSNIFIVCGKVDLKKLLISILISVGTGLLSVLLTMGNYASYGKLNSPSFAPPAWIFALVWTILYLLMGIACYRIWMHGGKFHKVNNALGFYGIQLGLNFLWSIIFFGFDLRGLAFLGILALLFFIIITIVKFGKICKAAAYLMVPYMLWVAYAAVLNYSVWVLNMGGK